MTKQGYNNVYNIGIWSSNIKPQKCDNEQIHKTSFHRK